MPLAQTNHWAMLLKGIQALVNGLIAQHHGKQNANSNYM